MHSSLCLKRRCGARVLTLIHDALCHDISFPVNHCLLMAMVKYVLCAIDVGRRKSITLMYSILFIEA